MTFPTRKVKHKFGAIRCEADDISFPSKLERSYFNQLKIRQKTGEILFFLRQVGFDLPGGARHFIDFVLFKNDGSVEFVECKGRDLPIGKLKREQVEALYPIEIKIVTKV